MRKKITTSNVLLLTLIAVALFLPDIANAAVADEFQSIYNKLETWRTGGLGRSIFLASLFGIAAGTLFSMRIVLMPSVAIALILGFGKPILEPLIGTGATF